MVLVAYGHVLQSPTGRGMEVPAFLFIRNEKFVLELEIQCTRELYDMETKRNKTLLIQDSLSLTRISHCNTTSWNIEAICNEAHESKVYYSY